ncbi:hypothetical protein VCHENC02_0403A, partial [Vibrio harveyi]
MTATAKCSIDIDTIGFDSQAING